MPALPRSRPRRRGGKTRGMRGQGPEHLHSVLIAKKADPVFTQYALSAYDVDGEYYCKIYGQQASYSDEETDDDE